MRVLHLFSNFKWTGPAEPALNLCVGLKALGVEVDFACGPDSGGKLNKVVETARARGIEPILDFYMSKHKHPFKNAYDSRRLSSLLARKRYDIIHCHMDNDHDIAVTPARRAQVPLVRSSYYGEGFACTARLKRLIRHTDFLIEPSGLALENDVKNFAVPREQIVELPGAVDIKRFDAKRDLSDARARFSLEKDAFVIGIVARMQTHRHYEDLFAAFHRLIQVAPEARLVVVGRGSKQERVGFQPVKDMGLEEHVTFTGFIDGDDYVAMLKVMDVGVYMVPGSDGTCRTVREMMAMGKPVVVAQRGMLPEIVRDGVDGLHFDNSVETLYQAFRRLRDNVAERIAMGTEAQKKARATFSIEAQAESVLEMYRKMLS